MMSPRQYIPTKTIMATLLWLVLLACGPLERLQEFNRQQQQLPTGVNHTLITPIVTPTLTVTPTTVISATATTEVELVWPVSLADGSEQVNFELVALSAQQTPASSPRRAEVKLVLRQLPPRLFNQASFEPLLAQLREKLTLSIPERNLVITSTGFKQEETNTNGRALVVIYFFNADLEDFRHVELILSGQGNPLVIPVPVE